MRLSAVDHDDPGWGPDTGFGVLNVEAALTRAAPPPDPLEPNDNMFWVDGRGFGRPDRLIFKGGKTRRLGATIDVFEDPADVYRIRLRGRSRVRITADPVRNDDVDLRVYRAQGEVARRQAAEAVGPPRHADRADHAAQPLRPRARVLRRGAGAGVARPRRAYALRVG